MHIARKNAQSIQSKILIIKFRVRNKFLFKFYFFSCIHNNINLRKYDIFRFYFLYFLRNKAFFNLNRVCWHDYIINELVPRKYKNRLYIITSSSN